MNTSDKTVFVGLSGGVDSSVAALRLKHAGYNVVGVFIKVWHPEFLTCNWEAERLDAMRVAAHLDIPFLTCDAEETYKNEVANYFIEEYKAGRTPNPDVFCNKAVKFGAFLKFAKEKGADFVATGHYAQVQEAEDKFYLLRGVDTNKDQSYFLWTLTQEQLRSILLPIGLSEKKEIREEAEKAHIPTAAKKDSQGICFLGHVDIPEFLSHFVDLEEGNVLDENGIIIGKHQGALVYTTGQRHGFKIHASDTVTKPNYVIDRDLENNTITVSETAPKMKAGDKVQLSSTNWISTKPEVGKKYQAQFYYRQKALNVEIIDISEDSCTLKVLETVTTAAIGQSCVLYEGDKCLGGGIISK